MVLERRTIGLPDHMKEKRLRSEEHSSNKDSIGYVNFLKSYRVYCQTNVL